jgi:hypothetical protein
MLRPLDPIPHLPDVWSAPRMESAVSELRISRREVVEYPGPPIVVVYGAIWAARKITKDIAEWYDDVVTGERVIRWKP